MYIDSTQFDKDGNFGPVQHLFYFI